MEQNHEQKKSQRVLRIIGFSWLALLTFVACSRFIGGLLWEIDLIANVSVIAAALAFVTFLVTVLMRRVKPSLFLCLIALLALWPHLWARWSSHFAMARSPSGEPISIVVVNANGDGNALANLEERILAMTRIPDIVAVIEAGHETGREFAESERIRQHFSFVVPPDPSNLYSIVILSQHPLHRLVFDTSLPDGRAPYAWDHSYVVNTGNSRFVFTAAHPPSPRTRSSWRSGNERTRALAHIIERGLKPLELPIIIAGDFNSTITGLRHRLLRKHSGLVPSDERAWEYDGTWPAHWPSFRLTLDRIWISPGLGDVSREVLDDIGSDHRPVRFGVVIPTQ